MADNDCYLFVDMNVPEKERKISVLCIECHDEKMPKTGAFYAGSKEGYGPFNFRCCLCGIFIHKADDEENKEKCETSV